MLLIKSCSTKLTLCHCIRAYVITLLYCDDIDMKYVMKVLMDCYMFNENAEHGFSIHDIVKRGYESKSEVGVVS